MVVIALGANDGLRGFPVKVTKDNLNKMLNYLKGKSVIAVLAGMKVPPNYGKEYVKEFDKIWGELQKKHKIKMVPFLLEGGCR